MTDKEYDLVCATVRPIAKKWITLAGVSWDRVHLRWARDRFNHERDGHGSACTAFCDASWEYLESNITFNCEAIWDAYFKNGKLEEAHELEEMIIHEIVHILVNEMREYDKDRHKETVGHEERVVTRIARAMQYIYSQGARKSKK